MLQPQTLRDGFVLFIYSLTESEPAGEGQRERERERERERDRGSQAGSALTG